MRILIVKLGALGDVLRTTPLLTALKKKYPSSHVTWVVDRACRGVLTQNKRIDELLDYSPEVVASLHGQDFDLAINLDKDEEALDCITAASAKSKMGFGRNLDGKLTPLDSNSDYAYQLGIDDDLKFKRNKKTYQQISFEQVGLKFQSEEYDFKIDREDRAFAEAHLKTLGIATNSQKNLIIGLNTGSGHRFAGKRLPAKTFAKLAALFKEKYDADVLLLGGKDELARNEEISALTSGMALPTGSHSIQRFAGIVSCCDLIVTGDTTAMHIAIATKTPAVTYFASTCPAEIELYGRGRKVISTITCAPCYKKICPIDEQCMKDMDAETIFKESMALLTVSAKA